MIKKLLFTFVLALIGTHTISAQVSIGTETPDDSAQLELQSTTTGFLLPRMTEKQRYYISSPAHGLMIYCTNCITNGEAQLYNGKAWTNMTGSAATAPKFACGDDVTFTYYGQTVTYGTIAGTGTNCWLDRNLGASQMAANSSDSNSYGDLYQWGRAADGHQLRKSPTSRDNCSCDAGPVVSGNEGGVWIGSDHNWLTPYNHNRWNVNETTSGTVVKTVDDPCPDGFRVPTGADWQAELDATNGITNAQSAFDNLKLPVAGYRTPVDGKLEGGEVFGYYWSSTASDNNSFHLYLFNAFAYIEKSNRATGLSVRCIKE